MQLLFTFVYFLQLSYIFCTFLKIYLHIGIVNLIIVNGGLYWEDFAYVTNVTKLLQNGGLVWVM